MPPTKFTPAAKPDLILEGSGIDIIRVERERQIKVENWTADHDDTHTSGCMAVAAASYALHSATMADNNAGWRARYEEMGCEIWPFDKDPWWKPSNDPVRDLAKAGALIAAEIDRILRFKRACYRTKETKVEAVQWNDNNLNQIQNIVKIIEISHIDKALTLETAGTELTLPLHWWVTKDITGMIRVCNSDDFRKIYEIYRGPIE